MDVNFIAKTWRLFRNGEIDVLDAFTYLPEAERGRFVAECYQLHQAGVLSTDKWRMALEVGWDHDHKMILKA
ncbi:MAG: hypothetical protein QF491_23615, partial [Alphaproteobacteria bacterium]|nr:hypothetical protein [Alphaproteobacteria bacterium]